MESAFSVTPFFWILSETQGWIRKDFLRNFCLIRRGGRKEHNRDMDIKSASHLFLFLYNLDIRKSKNRIQSKYQGGADMDSEGLVLILNGTQLAIGAVLAVLAFLL